MKVRALRGVCIGVEQHLKLDDVADLDAAQVQFLVSIGAVERLPDEAVVTVEPKAKAAKSKPKASAEPDQKE